MMEFETKIAIVLRADLESWQKLNIAAFLSTGLIAENPEIAGNPYEDADGNEFNRLIIQPISIYGTDLAGLRRAADRARTRGVKIAIFVEEMFATMHDDANRAAVKAQSFADLNLVGIALRAEKKLANKVLDGLKFHQ